MDFECGGDIVSGASTAKTQKSSGVLLGNHEVLQGHMRLIQIDTRAGGAVPQSVIAAEDYHLMRSDADVIYQACDQRCHASEHGCCVRNMPQLPGILVV